MSSAKASRRFSPVRWRYDGWANNSY